MQESHYWGENSAAPDHLTNGEESYLDRLYELVQLTINEIDDGRVIGGRELERDARIGLKILVAVEEMPPENIATQQEFLCSLLFHAAEMLERHDLRIFAGRILEKVMEIDPDYLPTESEVMDEVPAQPKDNPLLEIPGL